MKKDKKQQTEKIRNPKIGPVGEAILVTIAAVGVISVFALFPGMASIIGPILKKRKYSQKQAVERNVKSLLRTGLIRKSFDKNGATSLELTKKGKWETFLRSGSHEVSKRKWDSLWRIVIFDVPITKNLIRRELRRAMILYGFKMIQQSVWVYPHPCDDFIVRVKEYLGIQQDVLYIKATYIENDKFLQKEFNLK